MAQITMRQLLEAGVHFGHLTKRWNPKMKPYIYGERNGVYIVNLQITMRQFRAAYMFARDIAAKGGTILFCGTKKQAQIVMAEEADRCEMPFVTSRWLGGMLTNFVTIRQSLRKLKRLEETLERGAALNLTKKEELNIQRDIARLEKNLSGIREMKGLPDAIFIVDPKKEHIAVLEARKLGIPIIGLVDTNCDPDGIDYLIAGNDDAIRSIKLISGTIADAIIEGRMMREAAGGKGANFDRGVSNDANDFAEETFDEGANDQGDAPAGSEVAPE